MSSPVEGPPNFISWVVDGWSGESADDFVVLWVGQRSWDVLIEVEEDEASVIVRLSRLSRPLPARTPAPQQRRTGPARGRALRGQTVISRVALSRPVGAREVVDGSKNRTIRHVNASEIPVSLRHPRSDTPVAATSHRDRSAADGSRERAEELQRRCLEYVEGHTSECGGDELRQDADGRWTYCVAFTGSLRRHQANLPDEVRVFEGRHSLDEFAAAEHELWPFLIERRVIPVARSVIAGRHVVVACRGDAWPDADVLQQVRRRFGSVVRLTTAEWPRPPHRR
ncbi:MAG: hypothetical protein PGN13_14480 [Patulibacter minatonensis]